MMKDFVTFCIAMVIVNLTEFLYFFDNIIPGKLILKIDFFIRKIGSSIILMLAFEHIGLGFISTCIGIILYWVCWSNRYYLLAVAKGVGVTIIYPFIKGQIQKNDKVSNVVRAYKKWTEEVVFSPETKNETSIDQEDSLSDYTDDVESYESRKKELEEEGGLVDVDL